MKHLPMRMCVQTRQKYPKMELVRFVIDPDTDQFALDTKGKIRSRGANLKKDIDVYDAAVRSGAFERALQKKISQDQYLAVRSQFEKFLKREELKQGKDKVHVRISGESIDLD